MINKVNSVNTEYLNTVQTSEMASTAKVDDSAENLEKKVYEQADITDKLELSSKGKGLGETAIRGMQDAINQNKLSFIQNMVNSTNNIYKQRGISSQQSLLNSYISSKLMNKNAYNAYFKYRSGETDEISSLKEQIAELENNISEMEKNEENAQD